MRKFQENRVRNGEVITAFQTGVQRVIYITIKHYPSPNLTLCPKREVSVNVTFGEG